MQRRHQLLLLATVVAAALAALTTAQHHPHSSLSQSAMQLNQPLQYAFDAVESPQLQSQSLMSADQQLNEALDLNPLELLADDESEFESDSQQQPWGRRGRWPGRRWPGRRWPGRRGPWPPRFIPGEFIDPYGPDLGPRIIVVEPRPVEIVPVTPDMPADQPPTGAEIVWPAAPWKAFREIVIEVEEPAPPAVEPTPIPAPVPTPAPAPTPTPAEPPVEPVEPTEPVPTQPPAQPTEPTEPTQPTPLPAPAKPAEPSQPEPVPAEPTQPTQPTPAEPTPTQPPAEQPAPAPASWQSTEQMQEQQPEAVAATGVFANWF